MGSEKLTRVTIVLNESESAMLDDLVKAGVFGITEADVLHRIFDERLQELAKDGTFTRLPYRARAGRDYPGEGTLKL